MTDTVREIFAANSSPLNRKYQSPLPREIFAASSPSIGEAGLTSDWRSETPEIIPDKCIAFKKNKLICQLCWGYCPEGVIKKGTPPVIDFDYCKGCGICAEECPNNAIVMKK